MNAFVEELLVNNKVNQILLGLILSRFPQSDRLQISSILQESLSLVDDESLAKKALEKALALVSSLPSEAQPRNMRDMLKVIQGGKSDS
jgi:hypothetical protein